MMRLLKFSNGFWWAACLGVLLLACAARLYQIDGPVLWLDEAFTVILARMSPMQILLHTARDVHPPLHYLLLHYWMAVFGDGLVAVRGLSVCCGVASVAVAMLITRQLGSRPTALLAGLLLALLPIAVRYSQEARMYAWVGLLLLAATWMLLNWVRAPSRHGFLFGYAALLSAAMYSHYFAVLGAMAHWLYLVTLPRVDGRRLVVSRAWWLCNLAVAIAYLPWLPSLLRQRAMVDSFGWITAVSSQTLPSTFWLFFTLGSDSTFLPFVFWSLPITFCLATIAFALGQRRVAKPAVLLAAFSYLPPIVAWLGSYLIPMYMIRYIVFAANGLPILLAVALQSVATRSKVLAALLILGSLSLEGAGLLRLYDGASNINGGPDWRNIRLDRVFEQLNSQWRPGDVIVVDGLFWYYTAAYYNRTGFEPRVYEDGLRGDNSGASRTTYGWTTLLYPRSEQLYLSDLAQLCAKSGRVWWVGVASGSTLGQHWPVGWRQVARIDGSEAQGLLFALPEPAGLCRDSGNTGSGGEVRAGTPAPSAALYQAATSLCGSKLSARANCHIRE
ncbi:glycosyltransferase family 39 protein [Pseudomonas sichuanensis]|uniref:glycosyltransferase family 39 protein n=1 Tax=Pseudomonas sichuanensis TaxID=2213015 RepID=UPI000DA6943A|nr:glycosyltransferase family 39 protein [Pseudomonas sichuanensis]